VEIGSVCLAAGLALSWLPRGAETERVVFMEPAEQAAGQAGELERYTVVTDAGRLEQLRGWLDNDDARWALDLHDAAWRVMRRRAGSDEPPPPYHIALVPQGNHAALGFRLLREDGAASDHPTTGYIELDPNPGDFSSTILHETAHVALMILAGGARRPAQGVASIPHTTAALTDRWTAFNEGFAIHLETLSAHLDTGAEARARFRHERLDFSHSGRPSDEYFRHAADLRSYSQSIARYAEVRDNTYAFASAHQGADYLRVQVEKSRDFATLRSADQLLQSEGFYASFFFAFAVRDDARPGREAIDTRHERALEALAAMFAGRPGDPAAPHLLHFVETYAEQHPGDADQVTDILLDLSHGVFVDAEAERLWHDHYMAAVRLDLQGLKIGDIQRARARWREAVRGDPAVLYARVGAQLPCEVPAREVLLVAFGQAAPLAFDLNTVQPGILRMIPGITEDEVEGWIAARTERPFADTDDFLARAGLGAVEDELRWAE
jgi:hypothetical protein